MCRTTLFHVDIAWVPAITRVKKSDQDYSADSAPGYNRDYSSLRRFADKTKTSTFAAGS
jgi:hypothetical protein